MRKKKKKKANFEFYHAGEKYPPFPSLWTKPKLFALGMSYILMYQLYT